MTPGDAAVLVAAGVGGGLATSTAGLASLVTYPALLWFGLPPVVANQTNTVSLTFSSIGSISGSFPELRDQRATARRLVVLCTAGAAVGCVLLLTLPGDTFEYVVPVLVAVGSLAVLFRRRLVDDEAGDAHARLYHPGIGAGAFAIGVYAGYFGAGAGVMMMALLLHATAADLPRANAVKNFVLGVANAVAAIVFVVVGTVRWSAVVPLGAGLFVGGRLGPAIVRRLPAGPLRIAIAVVGLALAAKLALETYG